MSLTRHMDQVVHSDLHRGSLVVYGLLICDACSLAGCLCTGLRFSHLSSGDSRFIVCNAQCPFLKDGLKWISGFGFGRVHSYRSHNLLAIYRLKSVKTVNDSHTNAGCFGPPPSVPWLGELTCHEPGCAHHDGPAGSRPDAHPPDLQSHYASALVCRLLLGKTNYCPTKYHTLPY